jgi:hypothetical protein
MLVVFPSRPEVVEAAQSPLNTEVNGTEAGKVVRERDHDGVGDGRRDSSAHARPLDEPGR